MFVVNRAPNSRAVIRNRIYGFMKRLVSSSNALVLSAVTSDARYRSKIVVPVHRACVKMTSRVGKHESSYWSNNFNTGLVSDIHIIGAFMFTNT